MAKSKESIASSNIPSLLDNSFQQDKFDQFSSVDVCSNVDKREDNTMDNMKIPLDIEVCYKQITSYRTTLKCSFGDIAYIILHA